MKKIILLTLSFLFLTLIFPREAFAAKFNLDPLTKGIKVGEQFSVNLSLDTQGKEVSGVQAKLSFNKDVIEVSGVSFSGIFPSNDHYIDNNGGYVQVGSSLELETSGFNGNSNWVTLTLKGKAKGSTELRFSCSESGILEIKTYNNLLDCGSLGAGSYTITEEGQPAPTATPTPTSGPGGPGCTDLSPNTPTNLGAASGPGNGEVTLTWTKVSADYYSLVFGGASGAYQYGAANIGNTNQYIVRQLNPGKLYYFAVAAVKGCASSGFSQEASTRAKGAGEVTPSQKITPIPTPFIYQPISEVFPEVEFPTQEEIISPTPTSVPEEEGKLLGITIKKLLAITFFLIVLIVVIFAFWRMIKRRQPPPPPHIVLPPEQAPPNQGQA